MSKRLKSCGRFKGLNVFGTRSLRRQIWLVTVIFRTHGRLTFLCPPAACCPRIVSSTRTRNVTTLCKRHRWPTLSAAYAHRQKEGAKRLSQATFARKVRNGVSVCRQSKSHETSFQLIWGVSLTGMREMTVNQTESLIRPSALPLLPRLATPRGLVLVRVGAGFKPFATLATYFEKVIKIEVRESFWFWVAGVASLSNDNEDQGRNSGQSGAPVWVG